jgi:hypothetical protein
VREPGESDRRFSARRRHDHESPSRVGSVLPLGDLTFVERAVAAGLSQPSGSGVGTDLPWALDARTELTTMIAFLDIGATVTGIPSPKSWWTLVLAGVAAVTQSGRSRKPTNLPSIVAYSGTTAKAHNEDPCGQEALASPPTAT